MKPLIAFAAFLLVVSGVILAFWSYDVRDDRRHTLSVLAETPVFVGSGGEECEGLQFTVVQKGAKLGVKRIRYWKNCATVDVALADGRKGHIVLGKGNVSITPPLE
jgi:hypothetical protein